jgi:hypothetical protein
MDLLKTINASPELRKLADDGNDAGVANAINAALPQPVPITSSSLLSAAPVTLAAIKASGDRQTMADIGKCVAHGDIVGLNVWANTFHLMETMPKDEFAAVQALIAAAGTFQPVTHEDVSAALSTIRHVDAEIKDAEGNIVQHAGAVRALPIEWSKVQ